MKMQTDVMVGKLKEKISKWDDAFKVFQTEAYPERLLAQVRYREQIETLLIQRRLVEKSFRVLTKS